MEVKLSRVARALRPSPIQRLSHLAQRCNAINLAEGFPDFPAPPHIKAAASSAISSDFNQYRFSFANLTMGPSSSCVFLFGIGFAAFLHHLLLTCKACARCLRLVIEISEGETRVGRESAHGRCYLLWPVRGICCVDTSKFVFQFCVFFINFFFFFLFVVEFLCCPYLVMDCILYISV